MNLLKDIIGHDDIISMLKGSLSSGRVAHAYLFSGPGGVGKLTTALAFAGALMCGSPPGGEGCGQCDGCRRVAGGIHPDVELIRPEGATMKIGQLRKMAAGTQYGPATGMWTVRILDGADLMTQEAANSLLKTLEEPVTGVVIILVTARPQAMLPTIVSRCQHMYFQPLLKSQVLKGMIRVAGEAGENMDLAASLAGGSLGKALELLAGGLSLRERAYGIVRSLAGASVEGALALAGDPALKKEAVVPLLEMMIIWFRDALMYNETGVRHLLNSDREEAIGSLAGCYGTGRLAEIIIDIEKAKGSLSASANVQLALEALFLGLAGKAPGFARLEEVF
ncbi:MAG TPA: DNA polymerase III subunit delta' [Desulfotomaculum sp.]|nr:DNA polymerase III subunit delta' [Desulfotomaculum sp.]